MQEFFFGMNCINFIVHKITFTKLKEVNSWENSTMNRFLFIIIILCGIQMSILSSSDYGTWTFANFCKHISTAMKVGVIGLTIMTKCGSRTLLNFFELCYFLNYFWLSCTLEQMFRTWKIRVAVNTEKLLIEMDPGLYYFINQGCLTVDNMDDKEEFQVVEVSRHLCRVFYLVLFFFFFAICVVAA